MEYVSLVISKQSATIEMKEDWYWNWNISLHSQNVQKNVMWFILGQNVGTNKQ